MRILVVGAGAVGGYYGGRLHGAGRDVTFLLRPERAERIARDGLHLVSPRGNAVLHPPTISAAQLREHAAAYDLVLLSTKAYSLEAAMQDVAPAVGPATLVLPLLNGLAHMPVLAARFGAERVLGGMVRIMADVSPAGEIVQQNELDELYFGFPRTNAETDAKGEALLRELTVPGFTAVLAPDITGTQWQKWWLLASMNVVCILANGALGSANGVPHGLSFVNAVLDECMAVSTANGYPPLPSLEQEMRARMAEPGSPITSSMFRDMQRGGDVEAEQILGDLIARANGVPVPLITAAYVRMKVYEAERGI